MHIVLIDDTPEHLELLSEFVSELRPHADISTLDDGRALPDVLATRHADLVLMDLMMPTVSGFELVRWLRDEARSPAPVIAISGLRTHDHDATLRHAGFTDSLMKPYSFSELARLLDEHLPG